MVKRVALFADSFHEVNGVGLTCREFEAFARRRQYPLLRVSAGPAHSLVQDGEQWALELPNSPLGFQLEPDLRFDLLFLQHLRRVEQAVREFNAEVVHITGPNHPGLLGALVAHRLRLPLAASWHTNVHEYAARRFGAWAERGALSLTLRFYRLARILLAPNPELAALLETSARRPCALMRRGVDCQAFSPVHRRRLDDHLVLGYVGRLSPEKNVRRLAAVERALEQAGLRHFRLEIVGSGAERDWLRSNIRRLTSYGTLRGEPLARTYANFDIFVFPSETDTYGNVIQEAMASGVPCVVTGKGGPKSLISHGIDGLIASGDLSLEHAVLTLAQNETLRRRLAQAARRKALSANWDQVFESVYSTYALELENRPLERSLSRPGLRPSDLHPELGSPSAD